MTFADTSAILNGCVDTYTDVWISRLTVAELENIKTSETKDSNIKYLARKAVRAIIFNNGYNVYHPNERKIDKFIKKHPTLSDINDHRIIAAAALLQKEKDYDVNFVTSDGAQYLAAKNIGLHVTFYEKKEDKDEYCGWKIVRPTNEQLAELYSHPENNIFAAKANEFVEIYVENELKDVQFWDGMKYRPLKYQNFKNTFGEKVAPRNLEQKMLFHLLQNENIKIKLCLGSFGDGKTWSMLQHALKGVKDGRFSKIIFVRNNVVTKGSRDIGYLSGNLVEKIRPYLMPIADLTSVEYLDELIETGILEPVPLAFMRGRDFSNGTLVFCDEAENLTKENIQLLIGRIGDESELWVAGDLKQIDDKIFERNNGIQKMVDRLKGNELFGMVKLIKSERSRTSQLADLLD